MTARKPLFVLAAVTALGIVAACDRVAPADPEPTPGPVAQPNSLNGTWNLLESHCGDPASDSFTAFYLKDGKVLAADTVNRPQDFIAAKRLVAEGIAVTAEQLADDSQPLKILLPPVA